MSGRSPRTALQRLRSRCVLASLSAALAWFSCAQPAFAQTTVGSNAQTYRVTVWTTTNGLPQGTINDIVQTPDGALWLATFAGLLRFDGLRFRCFDLDTLPDLRSIRITGLTLDGEGGLWVVTQNGHALRMRDGVILEAHALPHAAEVLSIVRDRTGAVWMRGSSGAVLRFAEGTWTEPIGPKKGGGTYENLCLDRDGLAVSNAQTELVRFDEKGERASTITAPGPIHALMSDREDRTWLGLGDGLARVHDGAIERVAIEPQLGRSVSAILADGSGGLWLGTSGGLRHVVPGAEGGAWIQIPVPLEIPASFDVRSLARDREGNVWVGSASQGLVRLTPHRVACSRADLFQQTVTALADDGAGGAWIAYGTGGLWRMRAGTTKLEQVPFSAAGSPRAGLYSLMRDAEDRLWVAAGMRIMREDRVLLAPNVSEIDPGWRAGTVVSTKDGRVWAAYGLRGNLIRIGPDDAIAESVELPDTIISVSPARDGSLWIGGPNQVWHLTEKGLETYGEKDGVPHGDVRDVLADRDGRVWIATYGGGLGVISDGRVTRIARAQGLADNSLTRILADDRDRLWILSNQGLMVAERRDLVAVAKGNAARVDPIVIGPESGMPEANFGSPAGFVNDAGMMWFGTVAGVVRIDPHEFPFNRNAPTVIVEHVTADETDLTLSNEIEVPAGTRRLGFEFTSFALSVPDRVHFRYRLDGFDDDWIENETLRQASFTGLRPGPYTFHVAARNEDGVWSQNPATITVRVLPAWWETDLFRIMVVVTALASLYALDRVRIGIIRRRAHTLLEATEGRARAEERESRLREELAHVARVATAGEMATSLAHEVNQPLAAIVTNAEAGRRFLARDDVDRTELDAILRDIAQQGQRASEVIQRLREFLRKQPTERRPLDLNQVVRNALPLVRRELEDHRVDLVLELMEHMPTVTVDPIQIQQVVVNLVNNACEAMSSTSGERRIEMSTSSQDGRVLLFVSDTGPGIAPALMGQIFEPYVTTKASGMGLGLAICRSIVEAHGGSLSAAAIDGEGARFRVELPQSSQTVVIP